MDWFDAIRSVLQMGIALYLFSYLGRPFLPEWYNEVAETVGMRFLILVSQAPGVIYKTSLVLSSLAYYIGLLFVVCLLGAGVFLFAYAMMAQLGFSHSSFDPIYEILSGISTKDEAWAGATVSVATTVAIGHAWSLRLNRIKFDKEIRKLDRDEKEYFEALRRQRRKIHSSDSMD